MTNKEIVEKIRNEYVCLEKTWQAITRGDYYRQETDLIIGTDTLMIPERLYDFFEEEA